MKKQPSFRDLTELSAYLDGELNASAQQRMKNRLARLHPERSDGRDPELASALDDLRLSRSILRRTPKRRAPRNFSLSPQMVAKRPPLPRLVPALNYASLAAMLLFLFSFLAPIGLGGNAAQAPEMLAAAPMAMAESTAAESAMELAPAPPAADSVMEEAPAAEAEAPVAATATDGMTAEKAYAEEAPALAQDERSMPVASPQAVPLLTAYQRMLIILLGLFVILGWVVRRATIAKWQKKVP